MKTQESEQECLFGISGGKIFGIWRYLSMRPCKSGIASQFVMSREAIGGLKWRLR